MERGDLQKINIGSLSHYPGCGPRVRGVEPLSGVRTPCLGCGHPVQGVDSMSRVWTPCLGCGPLSGPLSRVWTPCPGCGPLSGCGPPVRGADPLS